MRVLVSIQYLRAFAAISVVTYHTLLEIVRPGPTEPFHLYALAFGVDIFFVISGFIMWTMLQGGEQRPLAFLRARAIRVVPLYWLALAVYLGVLFLQDGGTTSHLPSLSEIAEAYLFIPYIDSRTGLNSPYYTLGWTLNYEMFFYLVFAFGLLFREATVRFGVILLIFAGLVLMRPVVGDSDPVLFRVTSPLLLEFFAGMAVAAARRHRLTLPPLVALAALVAALAFLVLISSTHHQSWPRAVYFGVPATLIVLGVVSLEERLSRRPQAPLLLFGDASYSIYLSHDIVLKLIFVYGSSFALLHPVIAFAGLLATEIALGVACYHRVEQPLLERLRHRLPSARRGVIPAIVPARTG
jgi:exopolysaccharide production protein ExoZ